LGKSPAKIVKEAVDEDLKEIGVDSVDLLLLHSPCDTIEQTWEAYFAMEDAYRSGKARAIGVSNFNASALAALLSSATVKPAVNQCGFSIGGHSLPVLGRDLDTLRYCKAHGITYAAYSPLGGLSGIHVLSNPDVAAVAKVHNKTTAQVALRWVVQQGIVATTSSSKAAYDKADLDIFGFALSDEEMSRLGVLGQVFSTLV